jgi:hypothetical protein
MGIGNSDCGGADVILRPKKTYADKTGGGGGVVGDDGGR